MLGRLNWRMGGLIALGVLAACGENNTYKAPPPPQVTVAKPVEQKITRYFEATGNTAAVNSANLVARVQGFLTEIAYQDGASVKKGQHLFTIEPEPYQLKLQQSQASETAAQATATQTQADFERQQELVQRQAASKAAYDTSVANRDNAKAKVMQAQADTKQAQINLDYTKVVAPFDGVVTARQVSIGELVGSGGTQVLATIVQLDPIYVNFTASERDVLHVRDMLYKRNQRAADLLGTEVDVGLQTDNGLSAQGQARLHRAAGEPGDRDARGARRAAERIAAPAARFLCTRSRAARGDAGHAHSLRRARQRSGRALCADGQRREHGGAAQGRGRPGRR